jgi:hypothetical protein
MERTILFFIQDNKCVVYIIFLCILKKNEVINIIL